MKATAIFGMLLLVLGLLAFAYQGVIWVSGTEQVAKIGPVQVFQEKSYPIALAPILGIGGIAVGTLLLVLGSRKGT